MNKLLAISQQKKMIEALYGIEFLSNDGNGGHGVVVLETSRILGGDSSFVFVGNYEVNNDTITADVKLTQRAELP